MQTSHDFSTLPVNTYRRHQPIREHPVFQALPPDAQARAAAEGTLLILSPGEEVPDDDRLSFVLAGVLGQSPGNRICVSAVVAGAVHGWDQVLAPTAPRLDTRAMIDTRLCRVPAQSLMEPLGREWLTRFVARQAPERIHALAVEAACNASHLVLERLAKWLVRLHCGANGAPLRITQADFGAMLGVQRTSVNAAAGRLQESGLVRFSRGKVQVVDLAGLRKASCGCGAYPVHGITGIDTPSVSRPASWSAAARADNHCSQAGLS